MGRRTYGLRGCEQTIRAYEALPVERDGVLFYGSSFFTVWGYEGAKEQMAGASGGRLSVVNHGFGGATADQLLYYYPRMVTPYAPRAMVIRSGVNDIKGAGLSGKEAWDCTERLCEWFLADYPGGPLAVIGCFDYESCPEDKRAGMAQYNEYARAYAAATNGACRYLDLNPLVYASAADIGTYRNFRDIFSEDKLHLTPAGYTVAAPFLARELLAIGF